MPQTDRRDAPLRGIALFLGALLCFSASDALAKFLSNGLPTIELAWMRYCVFVVFSLLLLRAEGGRLRLGQPGQQILRGLGLVSSAIFFMISLRSLPIAEAATIGFASPILIIILAIPMLGERVGLRRWAAILLGMAGVIVVVRPGTAAFQPAALWTLASSLAWAVASIITRRMSGMHPASMLVWSALTGWLVLSVMMPFVAVWPTTTEIALTFAMGIAASSGQYLMILAYRWAGAAVLAPFAYTQLLWAIITGYVVFNATPDTATLIGGAIIAGSGLWSARNERGAKV